MLMRVLLASAGGDGLCSFCAHLRRCRQRNHDMMTLSYRLTEKVPRVLGPQPTALRGEGRALQGPCTPDPHPHPGGALRGTRGLRLGADRDDRSRGLACLAAPPRAAPQPPRRRGTPREPRLLPARI